MRPVGAVVRRHDRAEMNKKDLLFSQERIFNGQTLYTLPVLQVFTIQSVTTSL